MSLLTVVRDFLEQSEPVGLREKDNAAVYSLQEFAKRVGPEELGELMNSGRELAHIPWVFRPRTRATFWTSVTQWRLPNFETLGHAALGLRVHMGEAWQPRSIVYDLASAKKVFGASFRDARITNERKRLAAIEDAFRKQILQATLGPSTPWFLRIS